MKTKAIAGVLVLVGGGVAGGLVGHAVGQGDAEVAARFDQAAASAELEELEAERRRLRDELAQALEERDAMRNELGSFDPAVDLGGTLAQAQEEIETLRKQVEATKAEAEKAFEQGRQAVQQELEQTRAQLEQARAQAQQQVEAARAEAARWRQQAEQTQQEVRGLREDVQRLEAQIKTLKEVKGIFGKD